MYTHVHIEKPRKFRKLNFEKGGWKGPQMVATLDLEKRWSWWTRLYPWGIQRLASTHSNFHPWGVGGLVVVLANSNPNCQDLSKSAFLGELLLCYLTGNISGAEISCGWHVDGMRARFGVRFHLWIHPHIVCTCICHLHIICRHACHLHHVRMTSTNHPHVICMLSIHHLHGQYPGKNLPKVKEVRLISQKVK